MKIAVLSAANSIHTVKIVNSLAGMGHRVRLYSMPQHRDVDGAVATDVEIVYLDDTSYLKNHRQLRRELSSFGARVLYAHYATGYGTVARKTGFHPTVLAVWGSDVYDFPRKSPVHGMLLRKNLAFADRIFSTSDVMARRTRRYVNGDILTTPFGVDLTDFTPGHRSDDGEICIGFLKAVSEKYGISYLLQAFAELTKRLPAYALRLSVYGDGDQLADMKALAAGLGIDGRVRFFGRIPHQQASDALRTMDIFCVPSTLDSESFGVSAVEAMACALPCVVSDVDGLCEVTVQGVTGLIVPRKNAGALCDALEKLVTDPALRRQMGAAGRARVEELYDWNRNIKTIEQGLLQAAGEI